MNGKHLIPALAAALLLGACSAGPQPAPSTPAAGADHDGGATEQRRPTPRLAITYDGGVMVLDATTLAQVADLPGEGYLRVHPAGDGRHVMLAESAGFTALDLGTWARPHGDHAHYLTAEPRRTGITIAAPEPGHVVVHDGTTVLFSDGTGTATAIPSADIGDPNAPRERVTAASAHHGVALARKDGSWLLTVGDEQARTGIAVLDAQKSRTAGSADCPGVHGVGAAADSVVVFGCQDGLLAVHGDRIVKVPSPTPGYARIGNMVATEAHPVVLGDYKVDADAKPERPTRVSLFDTRTDTLELVHLPASYSFRSLARGQFGAALVLGTDGMLRILDPDASAVTAELRVTEPWTESARWQDPRPAVSTLGSVAYVTDPAAKTVTAVDIPTRAIVGRAGLPHIPDETAGVTGAVM